MLGKYSLYDAFGYLMSSQSFLSVLHDCRKNYLSRPLEKSIFWGRKQLTSMQFHKKLRKTCTYTLSVSLNQSSHISKAAGWQSKGKHSLSTFIFNSLLSIKYELYNYNGSHNKMENRKYIRIMYIKLNFIFKIPYFLLYFH